MNEEAVEQLTMHAGLWRALEARQFVLRPPAADRGGGGRLVGAEALIRWNHPDLGLVSPGRFIPVAEETGLIVQIGDWVLGEACREAMRWRDAGRGDVVVAVNLSAVQFKRGDLEQSVLRALEDTGLEPRLLELELTESILIREQRKCAFSRQAAQADGRQAVDRRFRNRLLQPLVPEAVRGRQAQDRPDLRA